MSAFPGEYHTCPPCLPLPASTVNKDIIGPSRMQPGSSPAQGYSMLLSPRPKGRVLAGTPPPRKEAAAPLTPASGEHYIALSPASRTFPILEGHPSQLPRSCPFFPPGSTEAH